MSTLKDIKTLLAKSVLCEINAIKKGDLRCANKMLKDRHAEYIRLHMVECMLDQENGYEKNKNIVDALYEQIKEITQYIILKEC